MQFKRYMFLLQYALFCNLILVDFVYTKAMVGHNIRDANLDEFPFVALLIRIFPEFVPERDIVCTATLISKNDILSSDQCVRNVLSNEIQVIVGSIDLGFPLKYNVVWWISFYQWAFTARNVFQFRDNDLAILRLKKSVSDGVMFASLSYLSYDDLIGKNVVAVGWGEPNNGSLPGNLQIAHLTVLENSECETRVSAFTGKPFKIDPNNICSIGDSYTLLINGDSGGPLLYDNNIVAVNAGTFLLPEHLNNTEQVNFHTIIKRYEEFFNDIILIK